MLVEVLIAYEAHVRKNATEQWRSDQVVYTMGGYKQKPRPHRVLEDEAR